VMNTTGSVVVIRCTTGGSPSLLAGIDASTLGATGSRVGLIESPGAGESVGEPTGSPVVEATTVGLRVTVVAGVLAVVVTPAWMLRPLAPHPLTSIATPLARSAATWHRITEGI